MIIEYQKEARVILCAKVPEPAFSAFSDTFFKTSLLSNISLPAPNW